MNGKHFSLILLPTNQCNVACEYCFEHKTRDRLTHTQLEVIVSRLLDHMEQRQIDAMTIYWQGGEIMTMTPDWFAEAHQRISALAEARGRCIRHALQTNLIGYGERWNPIIHQMFGSEVGTSMDFPNLHRKLFNGSAEAYSTIWLRNVEQAHAAGIELKVIAVLHPGTLEAGAEAFYNFFVHQAGIRDFQLNTPFPGGEDNPTKDAIAGLDMSQMIDFHAQLFDLWLTRGHEDGVLIGPFDALLDYFSDRPAMLPCIWGANCADNFASIDARGHVAQCDCWVTSYPEYRFGNALEQTDFTALMRDSRARADFVQRPVSLIDQGCIDCEFLSLCHGGCPVRAYSQYGTLNQRDPYCRLYKALFAQARAAAHRLEPRAQLA